MEAPSSASDRAGPGAPGFDIVHRESTTVAPKRFHGRACALVLATVAAGTLLAIAGALSPARAETQLVKIGSCDARSRTPDTCPAPIARTGLKPGLGVLR
jgi:hypothetical protein